MINSENPQEFQTLLTRYNLLLNHSTDAIYTLSADGKLTYLTPTFLDKLGWDSNRVLGRKLALPVHPDDVALARFAYHQLRAGEPVQPYQLRIHFRDGSYQRYEFVNYPEYEGNQLQSIFGIARHIPDTTDATAIDLADTILKRLAIITDLVRSTTYVSRNSLAVMNLNIAKIERGLRAPDKLSSMQNLKWQIKHLTVLIEEVLLLTELDADRKIFEFTEADLSVLLRTLFGALHPLADAKSIRFALQTVPLPALMLDQGLFYRACSEVVLNAIENTALGGRVEITVSATDAEAIIQVSDTGIGISEELLPHIFDRFVREVPADSEPDKLGIGLAIAKSIVEKHGGTIDTTSRVAVGSSFFITIPIPKQQ